MMFTKNVIIRGIYITYPYLFYFKIFIEKDNKDFPYITLIIFLQIIIYKFFQRSFPSLKINTIKMNNTFFPSFINIGYTTIRNIFYNVAILILQ